MEYKHLFLVISYYFKIIILQFYYIFLLLECCMTLSTILSLYKSLIFLMCICNERADDLSVSFLFLFLGQLILKHITGNNFCSCHGYNNKKGDIIFIELNICSKNVKVPKFPKIYFRITILI